MLFNRHFVWPSFYYNDFFPSVYLTKGSSLSVKAQEDNDKVIYELNIPTDVDLDSIEATKEDGVLKVVMTKVKLKEEDKSKVKIK